jgi:hypothetical protein
MSYVTTIASTASPDEAKAFNELSNRREAAVLRRLAPLNAIPRGGIIQGYSVMPLNEAKTKEGQRIHFNDALLGPIPLRKRPKDRVLALKWLPDAYIDALDRAIGPVSNLILHDGRCREMFDSWPRKGQAVPEPGDLIKADAVYHHGYCDYRKCPTRIWRVVHVQPVWLHPQWSFMTEQYEVYAIGQFVEVEVIPPEDEYAAAGQLRTLLQ